MGVQGILYKSTDAGSSMAMLAIGIMMLAGSVMNIEKFYKIRDIQPVNVPGDVSKQLISKLDEIMKLGSVAVGQPVHQRRTNNDGARLLNEITEAYMQNKKEDLAVNFNQEP